VGDPQGSGVGVDGAVAGGLEGSMRVFEDRRFSDLFFVLALVVFALVAFGVHVGGLSFVREIAVGLLLLVLGAVV
jgi:hypothetical protein